MVAADLVRARDRLLAAGLGPAELRAALVDLHEFWLTAHAAQAGVGAGVALVAVGGLARRDLVPHADLDLVLVHDGARDRVADLADRLWYPLWDAGVGLDHAVRTVGEALEVAGQDLRTAIGLLDTRHIAGDAAVADRLAASARERWRLGARARLADVVGSVRERWARAGEVAQWAEPELKHGRGGLRDVAVLRALAVAQLVDRPGPDVVAAHELLLDTRTELRRATRRPRDTVRPQDGDGIAAALGLADRFALTRALSGAGRTVAYALDVALRAATPGPRRAFGALRRGPDRRPLDTGVVLHEGSVALARDADPARDPGLLLRVAAAAGRTARPIAAGTLARLAEAAPEPRQPWPHDVRQDLVALLGTGEGLPEVVEALDRTGLWARLLPEWGAVRDLPPRDAAHVWTVDRHLVHTTVNAARLATRVARPDLLLLAALLHDIGKGRAEDHSVVGAAIAGRVATRLGFPVGDVATVTAVVRHHLLLPHTATRRDVADPATVHRVVTAVDHDPLVLDLLHALAEADSLATGPGVWTPWRAGLVADLVTHCRTALSGRPLPGPDPLTAAQRALAEACAATGKPDLVVVDGACTVVARDRPGILSRAAGVLALNNLEVHTATMSTHADVAVGVLTATPRFGTTPPTALLREQFTRALAGSLALAAKLAAKERDYGRRPPEAPLVLWSDDGAVVELRAPDRIGLLHDIATALERSGLNIRWARATTLGGSAVDAFGVAPHPTPARRTVIESTLRGAIG